ncbi:MAG TPA: L-lysine 6-transaminase [Candidatus Kapabacteria bacterium]|nr:L-lysine 6-transaminase [Candidatus Kapabacteria bacterium]
MKTNQYIPKYNVEAKDVTTELSKYMLVDGFPICLDLEKSYDGYFVDSMNDTEYNDFFSCFASLPIGLNHPKINNDEFINYIGKIAVNKPSNSDIYTEAMATFVKTFFKIAVPDYFKYSFYICGGALAVENALKTAFDWKVRKNFAKGYSREVGHQIIHFREAFHGRTGYTMSLTNTDPNKVNYYPKFEWPRIISPKMVFPLNQNNLEYTMKLENQAIESIKQAFLDNKDDIAGIIIEPIQGEGGDNHFRPEFMKQLRNLADENEALLIFDEVQTGLGLTGTWWAHQQLETKPDLMCFGKKMQVCGILATDRVDDIPDNVFHTSSRINSTWGGNLVDMVRSTRYLEIIEEENLLENVKEQGKFLMQELHSIENEFPNMISNVRGKGLFCAFDFPNSEIRNKVRELCFENKLIILACGDKSLRFRPSLNAKRKQLEDGLAIVRNCIAQVK